MEEIEMNKDLRSLAQVRVWEHDRRFRANVQAGLDDPRPAVSQMKVEAHFAERRAAALRKSA